MVSKDVLAFLMQMDEYNKCIQNLNNTADVAPKGMFATGLDYSPREIKWQLVARGGDGESKVVYENSSRERMLGYMRCLSEDKTKLKQLLGGPEEPKPSPRKSVMMEWERTRSSTPSFKSGRVELVNLSHPRAVNKGMIVRADGEGLVTFNLPPTLNEDIVEPFGIVRFTNSVGMGDWEVISITMYSTKGDRVVVLRNPAAAHYVIKVIEG